MPSQPQNLQKLLANKEGKLNTSLFNFLENLLVFRTLPDLSVPRESGVKFSIRRQEGDPGICLLIHTDNQRFPSFESDVPRPDYLALYLHGSGCICTIIEMKSRDSKNLEHGLEQIKSLADRLKREFAEHLPPRFRLEIQGILLCHTNAQLPNPLIAKMARSGLTIFPALCDTRAELYPYISQKNELIERFENRPRRNPTAIGPIEELMSCRTLNNRLADETDEERLSTGTGLHVNLMLSGAGEYAVLTTRAKKCVFIVKEDGEEHQQRLREDIVANNLEDKFAVEAMPQ